MRVRVRTGPTVVLLVLMSALLVFLAWPVRDLVATGANDFLSFYAGARLVGTPDLYNGAAVRRFQTREIGIPSDTLPFTLPPYYAVMLWPLGRLPYFPAYVIWQVLNVAALAGFI